MKRSLLWGHTDAVLDFVGKRAPIERPVWRDVAAAVGILRADGLLIGGVVFAEYRPDFGTSEFSAAAISSLVADTRIVRELGAFAFGQLALYRLFARTSTRNERAKRALAGLGFKAEGIKAHFWGQGRHAADYRLLRPEFEERWGRIRKAA